MIPINMAFFFQSSSGLARDAHLSQPGGSDRIAAAAGNLERASCRTIPLLEQMEPDVEALLVNRVGQPARLRAAEYYIAAHRRVLQAGGPDPHALARTFGRNRSVARDWQFLRPTRGPRQK